MTAFVRGKEEAIAGLHDPHNTDPLYAAGVAEGQQLWQQFITSKHDHWPPRFRNRIVIPARTRSAASLS